MGVGMRGFAVSAKSLASLFIVARMLANGSITCSRCKVQCIDERMGFKIWRR